MLQPISKRIIVQPEEEKKGSLLLVSNQKPKRFKVLAIGDEVTKVKINDIIYLDKYAGAEVEHDGEKYMVIEENCILAKLQS